VSADTPADSGNGLLPDEWEKLAPLVDAILDAPVERRAAVLADVSDGNPDLRATLERLVAECQREMPLLDRPAVERFDQLLDEGVALPDVVADRYRTGHEVGRGGMARVYRARDLKHDRDVAIKVVRAELAASLGRDRFLREIAIAARLQHPNILPLYDSGDANGSLYFVMPFEAGPSLRERLARSGALPVTEAVSVLRDVARALQYAHAQGVVHRDIKPDNVLLSGGTAVVADFGIAKAFTAAQTDASRMTMTQAGAGIGTPAYMAPEQAVGDPSIDHRADLYSYGCLAYEVFTGQPPFKGDSAHELIAAHVGSTPKPLQMLRADVPDAIAHLVGRCLEKLPAARPQSAAELLAVLEHPEVMSNPRRTRRFRSAAIAVAGLAAVLLGSFVVFRPEPRVSSTEFTLAVLPFGNTAADTSVDFLTDGLPDEIASVLGRVPGIQIRSRSGARRYRGRLYVDAKEAGATLGAEYIMHAVVRLERGQWILSADVSRTSDRTSIWGDQFALNFDQQVGSVTTITESLLATLRLQFPQIGAAPRAATSNPTANPEAYRLYLRGQERLSRRGLSVKESAELFQRAIDEDSMFAPAFSGLSISLAFFPYFQGVPATEVTDSVVSAARRALQLDSSLAQPHIALGLAHQFANRWDSAEAEYRTAIQRDSNDVEARLQYGRHLLLRLRNADAMVHLRAARAEDPASAVVLSWMSAGYLLAGQVDSALAESQRAFESDSSNVTTLNWRARSLLAAHRLDEARDVISRMSVRTQNQPGYYQLGYFLARAGDVEGARRLIAQLDSLSPQPWLAHTERFTTYVGLGATAKALDALELATQKGEIWSNLQPVNGDMFDAVRSSPRFVALLRAVGLPESAATIRRRR
jgi:serine/threonine protein kinase/Tfp pilus assembly protein PilF